jgi:structural maintenance of chromosome 2
VKGFDHSKVKGLIASLVKVKDTTAATALEVVGGGKLYQVKAKFFFMPQKFHLFPKKNIIRLHPLCIQVVVDTEATGKLLLEKGQLKKRVTIIPLNRIQSNTLPNSVVDAAQKIAGNKSKVQS